MWLTLCGVWSHHGLTKNYIIFFLWQPSTKVRKYQNQVKIKINFRSECTKKKYFPLYLIVFEKILSMIFFFAFFLSFFFSCLFRVLYIYLCSVFFVFSFCHCNKLRFHLKIRLVLSKYSILTKQQTWYATIYCNTCGGMKKLRQNNYSNLSFNPNEKEKRKWGTISKDWIVCGWNDSR